MKGVLVDTSVWIDHFRHRNGALVDLLQLELVVGHPLILGELACGSLPNRVATLSDLDRLRQVEQSSVREVVAFIAHADLFGLGCGLVDLSLLSSTLMTPDVALWTLDQRLGALADRFGVMHRPALR